MLFRIVIFVFTASVACAAEDRALLARFEMTAGAFDYGRPPRKSAVVLFFRNRLVEGERVSDDGTKLVLALGTFETMRLMERLEKIDLPNIDYQKYFDDLAKHPPKDGKQQWTTMDGQEVEVEMRIKKIVVRFKMWNPSAFFYSYDGDKVVAAVNRALEAVMLEFGRSAVYF